MGCVDGLKSPKFEKIYRASFEWMPYRLDGWRLVPEPRRLYLTPENGYEFPRRRKNWKLDRPRPVGKDPIEWLLESVD